MHPRLAAALFLSSLLLTTRLVADDSISYVWRDGTHSHMRSSGPIETAVRASKKWEGAFLWARVGRRDYLMRDAVTLAGVREAFAPLDAFEPTVRAAENRLKPFEKKTEALERKVDKLSDSLDDESLSDSEREAIEARLREAEKELRAAEKPLKELEEDVEAADRESEARERVAEKKLERIILEAIRTGVATRVD